MKTKNRVWVLSLTLAMLLSMKADEARAQVQLFKAPQAFPAGPDPVAEITGDFNGDGKMDVAVVNNSAGSMSVLLSNGDGTFQPPVSYAVGNGPAAIVAGDFNGDNKLDLAVANHTDETVSILLGKSDGTFQPAVSYPAIIEASWLAAGDFNNDGKLDLAVNSGQMVMSVLLGNGDGTFQAPVSYTTGYSYTVGTYPTNYTRYFLGTSSTVAGDFNNDGKADLLLLATLTTYGCHKTIYGEVCGGSSSNSFEIIVGNGDGTFQNYTQCCTGAGSSPAIADLNGDGKLDVVVSSGNRISVYLSNGDGTFQAPTAYATPSGSGPLAIGDVNGDGKLDVVQGTTSVGPTNDNGGLSVLLGNGDGTFQTAVEYAAGPYMSAIAIFEAGGKADIAALNNVANGTVTVLAGNGNGTFEQPPRIQFGCCAAIPMSAAVGDFNGDGKLDFVVAMSSGGSAGIGVLLGNGDGTFQPPAMVPVFAPYGVATGDFNRDGKLDLAVAGLGTGRYVLLGNGDGTFQPPVGYGTQDSGTHPSAAVGDFNGNGKLDLVFTDGNGHVDILLGNGDGTFQGSVSYSTGQACDPTSVAVCMEVPAVGDFNGDGKLDLAVPDVATNTVNILLGNGDGTFQAPVTYPVGAQPTALSVADFNGDGELDLAVGNNGDSTISILQGNGDGTFKKAVSYPVASTPGAIIIGDFNGDGIVDVAAQGSGMVSVLLGKADGTFQPQINYSFGDAQFATGIAAGDFDGDYTTDLVVGGGLGNFADSSVYVLFNAAGFYLHLAESGTGGGTVTSVPAGIDCNAKCSASFPGGAKVTVTATPNSTSNFTGWSGACSGTGPCSITMKAAMSVTATFTRQDFSLSPASTKLTLRPGGQGSDVLTMAGLNGPFTNAIQLNCAVTGPAPLPACSFSATAVTPGSNSVSSTLTITAPASVAALQAPLSHWQSKFLYALWFPLMFGITVVGGSRKLRHGHWMLCSMLLLGLLPQTACGGGNNNNGNGSGGQGPMNYTATISGTSGAIQHTTRLTVPIENSVLLKKGKPRQEGTKFVRS